MNIFDNREQSGQIEASAEPADSFTTFGGEYWDNDYKFAEYGLDLGDIAVFNVSPKQYMALGLTIVNHLMTNGYDFEIDKDVNGSFLKESTIYEK